MADAVYRQKATFRCWQLPADGTLTDAPTWVTAAAAAGNLVNVDTAWIVRQPRQGSPTTQRRAHFGDFLRLHDGGAITPEAADVFARHFEPVS